MRQASQCLSPERPRPGAPAPLSPLFIPTAPTAGKELQDIQAPPRQPPAATADSRRSLIPFQALHETRIDSYPRNTRRRGLRRDGAPSPRAAAENCRPGPHPETPSATPRSSGSAAVQEAGSGVIRLRICVKDRYARLLKPDPHWLSGGWPNLDMAPGHPLDRIGARKAPSGWRPANTGVARKWAGAPRGRPWAKRTRA